MHHRQHSHGNILLDAVSSRQEQNMIATEAEIIIPGSFVVLQGNAGDGMSNTVDKCCRCLPKHTMAVNDEDDDDDGDDDEDDDESSDNDDEDVRRPPTSSVSSSPEQDYQHVQNAVETAPQQATTKTTTTTTTTSKTNNTTPPTLGQLATRPPTKTGMGLSGLATQQASSSQPNTNPQASIIVGGGDDSSYIVVTDTDPTTTTQKASSSHRRRHRRRRRRRTQSHNTAVAGEDARAIDEWKVKGRNHELRTRQDWKDALGDHQQQPQSQNPATDASLYLEHTMMRVKDETEEWWQQDGRLAIFSEIPTRTSSGQVVVVKKNVIGTLSPGSTIVATGIVCLDSVTMGRLPIPPTTSSGGTSPHNIFPRGRVGWIQLVKLATEDDNDQQQQQQQQQQPGGRRAGGFAVLSLDGYPLMAPGLPSLYVDPSVWVWRVTCPAGAFVREGLDLNTQHTDTLPYGSLIRVTRRTLNGQGLSRLRVHSMMDDIDNDDGIIAISNRQPNKLNIHNKPHWVDGWCSEFLNPLSGQRGIVAQPLPFPVPALYRVTLSLGAVIRGDIELSSPQIGLAPMGAILKIVGRAFSEHPVDKCIERLQLAGNGGWISVRLNRPPPMDDLIVEFMGIDGTFDPESPGQYHMEALRAVEASQQASSRGGDDDISSVDESNDNYSLDSVEKETTYNASGASAGNNQNQRHGPDPGRCLICLTEERNATIVHGETGHIACCLVCSRILKARGDKVRQHFYAPFIIFHIRKRVS